MDLSHIFSDKIRYVSRNVISYVKYMTVIQEEEEEKADKERPAGNVELF